MTKINPRITAKCHAHLQTLTKTPVKFKKDPDNIVGGVAFIRLDTICEDIMSPDSDERAEDNCIEWWEKG